LEEKERDRVEQELSGNRKRATARFRAQTGVGSFLGIFDTGAVKNTGKAVLAREWLAERVGKKTHRQPEKPRRPKNGSTRATYRETEA